MAATRQFTGFLLMIELLIRLNLTRSLFNIPGNCIKPLGMENGKIPDHNISASMSSFDNNWEMFGAHQARLKSSSGFRADPSVVEQTSFHYIKVELPKEMIITAIATQGLGEEWVAKYTLMASQKGEDFVWFRGDNDNITEKEFKGNSDGVNIQFNTVPYPIQTREVFIVPKHWHENIALRFELYGCEPGYYFSVWLSVLNKTFMLSYMKRQHYVKELLEEEVLYEVKEYLKDVPGFLSLELHQFSPPFVEKDIKQTGITAAIKVYCIEFTIKPILSQLQYSLANQRRPPKFGTTILQIQYPVTETCQPPGLTITLGKNPWNAQLVMVNEEDYWSKFTLSASLQPGCNHREDVMYNWEVAFVDKQSGLFSMMHPYGEISGNANLSLIPGLIRPAGLKYIRCLVRSKYRISAYKYDFGFIETMFMRPLQCEITPSQGRAILDDFTLRCNNAKYGADEATGYKVTLDFSGKRVLFPNWRQPNGTLRLPVGNSAEDYSVRLKVEATFLSFPSLFDEVVAKVTGLTKSEIFKVFRILEELIDTGKHEEAAYNMWVLKDIAENMEMASTSRAAIKGDMMRGVSKLELRSDQQLKHIGDCVVFSNKIKHETTQEIQEISLQYVDNAVNFLHKQRSDSISNISDMTETLLKGTALVVGMASEDAKYSSNSPDETRGTGKAKNITIKAVGSIHKIADLGRKVLLNDTNVNLTQMEAHGVTLLLSKVNTSLVGNHLLRLKDNEIQLPVGVFTRELKQALQGGSTQIIRLKYNPYTWKTGIITKNLSVIELSMWSNNGTELKISNLSTPIKIVFRKTHPETKEYGEPESSLFLKSGEMRYHSLSIPSFEATVIVRVKPLQNVTLRVYVRKDLRPTHQDYVLNFTLPSFSNVTREENIGFSSLDRYRFDLLPNATGYIGLHFIGIEMQDDALNITASTSIMKNISGKSVVATRTELVSCVNEKPPLTAEPLQRQFNPKTDVNYTFFVAVGSCVFWDTVTEEWSARGCQVAKESNETRVDCLTNHLTSFAGQFFVVPNSIDFHHVSNARTPIPPENLFVMCTVFLMYACYFVGLLFARKADIRDKMKVVKGKGPSYQREQQKAYTYEVSIQTGMWFGHGTTARVGIKLYGEGGSSDSIRLMDPWQEIKLFSRGSVNSFVLYLPVYLGQLHKIRVWHDNSGKGPSWYLYQVVVKDLSNDEKWHFVANRWLAVEMFDGEIDIEVNATPDDELNTFKSICQWRAVTNFADRHLFLSLFTRPPQSPFTRCQRLTCMLSIILVSMVTNAMFYQVQEMSDPNSFQIGPLELSLRQTVIGLQSGLISLPASIFTVMIFRNIKRRTLQGNSKENDSLKRKEKSSQGFLPPWFAVIGWLVCLTASMFSGAATILYSIQWGADTSNQWLMSVGISFVEDMILIGPISIIINTSIMSIISRKPSDNDAVDIEQQELLVFREDELMDIHQPSEEELLRARRFGRQQRKVRQFVLELVIYITIVVLLITICYANRKPSSYQLTKSIKNTFSGFYQVQNTRSFWTWFEYELVPGLYDARLYDGFEDSANDNEAGLIKSKIGFTASLPRIRQIRIRPDFQCRVLQVEPMLRFHFKRCFSDLSDSNEDTTPLYKPGWRPLKNDTVDQITELLTFCPAPWRHTESTMSIGKHLLPYSGAGYVANLGYDTVSALQVKQTIEQNQWIDEQSAVVLVEFVIFEPANLFLSNVMIIYERMLTGMTAKKIDIVTEYIFPSSGSSLRKFYRLCILLWIIIILVLVILEIWTVVKQRRAYVKKFFNWISFLQLLSSSCAILIVILKENGLRDFLQRIREDPFGSWSAFELVKWAKIEEAVLSFTVVLTTIKCLKLLQFNRHVHVMKWTLQASYHYLCSFSIIILILAIAFAHLGTLLFGSIDEEYATLSSSLRAVLQMAVGFGKSRSKLSGGSVLQLFSPVFLMACMLSMTITFIDTFIAILQNAYHSASGREYPGDELCTFIKQRFKARFQQNETKLPFKKYFQSSLRRKSLSQKFAKQDIQSTSVNVAPEQAKRCKAQHAETESLLRYERLHEQVNLDIHAASKRYATLTNREVGGVNIPPSPELKSRNEDGVVQRTESAERNLWTNEDICQHDFESTQTVYDRDTWIKISATTQDHNVKTGFPMDMDVSSLKFPPTEEELLLHDVKQAMKNTRLALVEHLAKNRKRH